MLSYKVSRHPPLCHEKKSYEISHKVAFRKFHNLVYKDVICRSFIAPIVQNSHHLPQLPFELQIGQIWQKINVPKSHFYRLLSIAIITQNAPIINAFFKDFAEILLLLGR